jgi:hypothetical protein
VPSSVPFEHIKSYVTRIMTMALVEASFTAMSLQHTIDFLTWGIAHAGNTKRSSSLFQKMLSTAGYTEIPSVPSTVYANARYDAGYLTEPEIHDVIRCDNGTIVYGDIKSCYGSIISEMDLCLTQHDRWTQLLKTEPPFRVGDPSKDLTAAAELYLDRLIKSRNTALNGRSPSPKSPMARITQHAVRLRAAIEARAEHAGAVKETLKRVSNVLIYGSLANKKYTYPARWLSAVISVVSRRWTPEVVTAAIRIAKQVDPDARMIQLALADAFMIQLPNVPSSSDQYKQFEQLTTRWMKDHFFVATLDLETYNRGLFLNKQNHLLIKVDPQTNQTIRGRNRINETTRKDKPAWSRNLVAKALEIILAAPDQESANKNFADFMDASSEHMLAVPKPPVPKIYEFEATAASLSKSPFFLTHQARPDGFTSRGYFYQRGSHDLARSLQPKGPAIDPSDYYQVYVVHFLIVAFCKAVLPYVDTKHEWFISKYPAARQLIQKAKERVAKLENKSLLSPREKLLTKLASVALNKAFAAVAAPVLLDADQNPDATIVVAPDNSAIQATGPMDVDSNSLPVAPPRNPLRASTSQSSMGFSRADIETVVRLDVRPETGETNALERARAAQTIKAVEAFQNAPQETTLDGFLNSFLLFVDSVFCV